MFTISQREIEREREREREKEIITLLLLCCGCLCSVAFPDHTHLLLPFLSNCADANYVHLTIFCNYKQTE